jgi:hypothetical protein
MFPLLRRNLQVILGPSIEVLSVADLVNVVFCPNAWYDGGRCLVVREELMLELMLHELRGPKGRCRLLISKG